MSTVYNSPPGTIFSDVGRLCTAGRYFEKFYELINLGSCCLLMASRTRVLGSPGVGEVAGFGSSSKIDANFNKTVGISSPPQLLCLTGGPSWGLWL